MRLDPPHQLVGPDSPHQLICHTNWWKVHHTKLLRVRSTTPNGGDRVAVCCSQDQIATNECCLYKGQGHEQNVSSRTRRFQLKVSMIMFSAVGQGHALHTRHGTSYAMRSMLCYCFGHCQKKMQVHFWFQCQFVCHCFSGQRVEHALEIVPIEQHTKSAVPNPILKAMSPGMRRDFPEGFVQ